MNAPESLGRSQWIGAPLRRLEDDALLRGAGRFTDDASAPRQTHAWFVRSPHPHARIRAIATDVARASPGVLAVLTGADAVAAGLRSMPFLEIHKRPDGTAIVGAPRLPLSVGVARYVGDAVAMVIAETRNAAKDAAEFVEVDYEPLPAVVDIFEAGGQTRRSYGSPHSRASMATPPRTTAQETRSPPTPRSQPRRMSREFA